MEKLYQKVWESLPGATFYAKRRQLGKFKRGLSAYVEDLRPEKSPYVVSTRDIGADLEAALGKTPSQCALMHIPICGITMLLRHVLTVADDPKHPLHKECLAFVTEHNIAMVPVGGDPRKRVLGRRVVK